jgi:hypothetical protein
MSDALANSAIPGWDNIEAVRVAAEYNFKFVQLFLDHRVKDPIYRKNLIDALNNTQLGVILHLPEVSKEGYTLNEEAKVAAEDIQKNLNSRDIKILVHYEEGMQVKDIPTIKGQKVALENSKNFVFDPNHVLKVIELTNQAGVGFVFDPERILFAVDDNGKAIDTEVIVEFVKNIMRKLKPGSDLIHLRDKTSWTESFRKSLCAFPHGINNAFISEVKDFSNQGGTIVWEYEHLDLALESSRALNSL